MSEGRLGRRKDLGWFSLLVMVNAFVGAMVGKGRTILPPIAEQVFHLAARSAVWSFSVVFGVTKALTRCLAGHRSDRFGRRSVLGGGWLVAVRMRETLSPATPGSVVVAPAGTSTADGPASAASPRAVT